MPGQPLSFVARNAAVRSYPAPFESHLVRRATEIISTASAVEAQLGTLLVTILGANAAPAAAAMLNSLHSASASRAAIMAAAEVTLRPDQFDVMQAVMRITSIAMKPRNLIAHCLWEYSPDLPDAILFVEQAAAMKLNLELQSDPGPADPSTTGWDKSLVWVYRAPDFQQALSAITRALHLIAKFRIELRMSPEHLERIGDALPRLSNEPDVREFLDRIQKGRKTNPE